MCSAIGPRNLTVHLKFIEGASSGIGIRLANKIGFWELQVPMPIVHVDVWSSRQQLLSLPVQFGF